MNMDCFEYARLSPGEAVNKMKQVWPRTMEYKLAVMKVLFESNREAFRHVAWCISGENDENWELAALEEGMVEMIVETCCPTEVRELMPRVKNQAVRNRFAKYQAAIGQNEHLNMQPNPSDPDPSEYLSLPENEVRKKFSTSTKSLEHNLAVLDILVANKKIREAVALGPHVGGAQDHGRQAIVDAGLVHVMEALMSGDDAIDYIIMSKNEKMQHWLRERLIFKREGKLPKNAFPHQKTDRMFFCIEKDCLILVDVLCEYRQLPISSHTPEKHWKSVIELAEYYNSQKIRNYALKQLEDVQKAKIR